MKVKVSSEIFHSVMLETDWLEFAPDCMEPHKKGSVKTH